MMFRKEVEMRKNFFIIVSLMLVSFNLIISSDSSCFLSAKKLYDIQNQIIKKSFVELPRGSWALHKDLKVVYIGEKISPKSGLKLRVVEFQGQMNGQLWFRIVQKKKNYGNNNLIFGTIEPMEVYIKGGNKVFYIPKVAIESFMSFQGKQLSTIIFEGKINVPPDCKKGVSIKEEKYTLPTGKTVNAYIIESLDNKAKMYCSTEVPFGMIKTVDSNGVEGNLPLIDFGFSGGKSLFTEDELKNAGNLPLFGGGGGFN